MFAAEVALHNYLLHSPSRTFDPTKADLFYIPVYSSCKYSKWAHGPDPWMGRDIMSEAILYVKQTYSTYFNRLGGRDHFVLATHDFGQCYDYRKSATERRGKFQTVAFENMGPLAELKNVIVLSTFGSVSSPCYNPLKDVVIPPFIAVPPQDTSIDSRPLKASWMVDMTKAKDGAMGNGVQHLKEVKRSIPVFFLGQLVWRNENGLVDHSYSFGLREKIKQWYSKSSHGKRVGRSSPRKKKFNWWSKRTVVHNDDHEDSWDVGAVQRDGRGGLPHEKYMMKVRHSVFCLAPAGFAPWSRRLYEVMIEGCIPIIIADDIVLPFQDQLEWNAFSVTVAEKVVKEGRLKKVLESIAKEKIVELQRVLMSVKESIVYRFPTAQPTEITGVLSEYPQKGENVWSFVLRELASKRMSWGGRSRW